MRLDELVVATRQDDLKGKLVRSFWVGKEGA